MKKSLMSLALLLAGPALAAPAALPSVTVYKSPTCGCCEDWVEHMRESGFDVTSVDTNYMESVKVRAGAKRGLGSCQTRPVGGFFIDGLGRAIVESSCCRTSQSIAA